MFPLKETFLLLLFTRDLFFTIFMGFFSQNFLISTKDLSGAVIFTFRRCFKRGILSSYYKIGVRKTSAKFLGKHICRRSLFSIKL